MDKRRLIFGSGVSLIDSKNRVAMPADLRKAIVANNLPQGNEDGQDFYIGKHPEADALLGFDMRFMHDLNERIREVERAKPVDDGLQVSFKARRSAFPRTETVPFDTSGRFTLSPAMLRRGQFVKHVFFYGIGDYLEIWNPHLLISLPDADPEMKEEARECLAEKGWLQ